jgi:hypothetical protein
MAWGMHNLDYYMTLSFTVRLDKLMLDESRATAAQTLEVSSDTQTGGPSWMVSVRPVPTLFRFLLSEVFICTDAGRERMGDQYLARSRVGFSCWLAKIGQYNVSHWMIESTVCKKL